MISRSPSPARAHVVRRAERHAGLGHAGAARLAGGERDAEVGDERAAVVQQDVLRLDVAVDHAVPMGVVQLAATSVAIRTASAMGCFSRLSRSRSVSPSTRGMT